MSNSINLADEEGSAIVDLIGFGLLLQIPVLMFAISALEIQRQNIALEAVARHGIRSFVLSSNLDLAKQAIDQLIIDYGLDKSKVSWILSCAPDKSCKDPDSLAYLEVKYEALFAKTASQIGTSG